MLYIISHCVYHPFIHVSKYSVSYSAFSCVTDCVFSGWGYTTLQSSSQRAFRSCTRITQTKPQSRFITGKLICLTFGVLVYFGCGITSLLFSFGHGTPCRLSKIMKKLFIVWKNIPIWCIRDDHAPNTVSPANISWLKLTDSSIQTFLKLIKWYTIQSQIHARLYLHPNCL